MSKGIERIGDVGAMNQLVGAPDAIKAGDHIYLSGVMATGPDGKIVGPDSLPEQLDQTLKNVAAALERAGASPADIVSTHFFLTRKPDDFPYGTGGEFERMCEVHRGFVGSYVPACTMLYVSSLPLPDALIQLSCVAIH